MPRSLNRKLTFTFNTFANGLSNDPNNWKTHGYYAAGLDLVGIRDIGNNFIGARPNALQLAQSLVPDTISGNTMPGLPYWIRKFNSNYYAFIPNTSSGGEGLIVSSNSNGTTWVSAKYTSAAVGGGGLEFLGINNALYYGQNAVLGQLSADGTYNNNFATFTDTVGNPRPMKVFAGVLNIGDGRYLATVDSSGTFTGAALTLPVGYIIRALEVLGDYLVISADNGTFARVFLWTGGTATFQEAYDLPETQAPALISREGRVFAVGKSIYVLNEVNFQTLNPYNYFGAPVSDQPLAGQVANWKNRALYGLSQSGGGTSNVDDAGGVYLIGQYDTTYPLINSLTFLLPNQATSAGNYTYAPNNIVVGGIFTDNSTIVKVAYRDTAASAISAQYGIASMHNIPQPTPSDYAYYLTLPLSMDSDNKKLFHSVRINIAGSTSQSDSGVSVYYRLDSDFMGLTQNLGNWTLLQTITNLDSQIAIPIRKSGRNIMFKFLLHGHAFGAGAAGEGVQLIDYTVQYSILDPYR